MARIVFTEYRSMAQGGVQGRVTPVPLASKGYVPAAGSAAADAFDASTRIVRVTTDTACHVGYGATADTDDPIVNPGNDGMLLEVPAATTLAFRTVA